MPRTIRVVRVAPADCVCVRCKGPTRNVAQIKIGARAIESYVCDACIEGMAPQFKRAQFDAGRPEPRRSDNLGGGYILTGSR